MHVAFLPLTILGAVNFVTIGTRIIWTNLYWINYGEAYEVNTCIIFTIKSVFTYEVYT
jgi:hypothetical protein